MPNSIEERRLDKGVMRHIVKVQDLAYLYRPWKAIWPHLIAR
jgi:hypothetical protein